MKEEVRFVKNERALGASEQVSKQRDDLSGPRLGDGKLAELCQFGKERMLYRIYYYSVVIIETDTDE